MSAVCIAERCDTPVLLPKVCCTFHWSLVTRPTKLAMWEVYADGEGPLEVQLSASGVGPRMTARYKQTLLQIKDEADKADKRVRM